MFFWVRTFSVCKSQGGKKTLPAGDSRFPDLQFGASGLDPLLPRNPRSTRQGLQPGPALPLIITQGIRTPTRSQYQ